MFENYMLALFIVQGSSFRCRMVRKRSAPGDKNKSSRQKSKSGEKQSNYSNKVNPVESCHRGREPVKSDEKTLINTYL